MPLLRSTLSPLYRGYVCSSCLARIQLSPCPPRLLQIVTRRYGTASASKKQKTSEQGSEPPDSNVTVRYFDESPNGTRQLVNDHPEEDKIEANFNLKIQELEAELALVQANLSKFSDRKKSSDQELMSTKIESMVSNLPPSSLDVPTLHDTLHDLHTETPRNIGIPRAAFPDDRHVSIMRLNAALESTPETDPEAVSKHCKELWKWYALSRNTLSSAWHQVPSEAWKILWTGFSMDSPANPGRMAHIRQLGEDMEAANIRLDTSQALLFIEALFQDGNHEIAIRRWELARAQLTLVNSSAIEYWTLGIRMLANDNQPELAQQAADILFNGLNGQPDSRVIIPLIRAWSISTDQFGVQKAWALYIRLMNRMAADMQMDDFDVISDIFLSAQETELALGVFKDMMLTGDSTIRRQDSVALYKITFGTAVNLDSFEFSPAETAWVSKVPLTKLPRKFRNKFFYGSWIKKLIGDGEVDSAAQVANLMYSHGLRPDSKYLNGIIGAWFRSRTGRNYVKAEELAWKMIGTRLEFFKRRTQPYEMKSELEGPLRLYVAQRQGDKKDFNRPSNWEASTMATLETFSVLLEHYQEEKRNDRVQELIGAIGAAELHPTTAFLNGLLDTGRRNNDQRWAWSVFVELVLRGQVMPDNNTWVLLWKLSKTHNDPLLNRSRRGFPSSRTLFAEMVRLAPSLKATDGLQILYQKIILCFGLGDDQIGTAVALRALQRLYNLYPNEDTVRSVVLQLAKTGVRNPSGHRTRRLNLDAAMNRRIKTVADILRILKEQRVQALSDEGVKYDALDTISKSEESIILLCNLLRHAVESKAKKDTPGRDMESGNVSDGIDTQVKIAAEEMGVPGCLPWTLS